MSKGLEALILMYDSLTDNIIDTQDEFCKVIEGIQYWKEKYYIIKKELKALEIIKNKKVNIFHIWALDDYLQYKQYYFFGEEHTEEDMLTEEEFKFLKEVLEDE